MKKALAVLLVICSLFTLCAVAVSAGEENFRPSVKEKPVPEIVPPDEDEPEIIAVIVNEEGEVIKKIPKGELIVTPYYEADSAKYQEITDCLHAAYASILNAKHMKELNSGLEEAVQKLFGKDYHDDDLIARDLFHVYLTGEYLECLNAEPGNHVKITFNLGKSRDFDTPIVMVTPEGKAWSITDFADVTNTIKESNHYISVNFYSVGGVVFMVLSDEAIGRNPETSEFVIILLIILFVAMVVSGITLIASGKRKKKVED